MKKVIGFIFFAFVVKTAVAQELYVFSEPASNMPAHSISGKLNASLINGDNIYGRFSQRYVPEIMFGINAKWMVHGYATFSNMHTPNFKQEALGFYTKFRFLSKDEIHEHFRMATFLSGSVTNAPFHYDEITIRGDKSGLQAGIIATQLWNKLAVSTTISHTQLLDKTRFDKVLYIPSRSYSAMNYSLSAGYLVLPINYTSYKQTNLNIYTEFLAQQTFNRKKHFIDAAPALQLIFGSTSKLNLGYRFQLAGNMDRMAKNSWLISYEYIFLNALKKRKK